MCAIILATFLAIVPTAAAAPSASYPQISIIYETETIGPWFENLVVRPSGTILASRMDTPQLWDIDPDRQTGVPLVEVPGVLSTAGIAEVAEDMYVFAAGNFSFETRAFVPGSLGVWAVDLAAVGDESPVPELVARFPDAGFLNGVAVWDNSRVLVSDTTRSLVYILDINTGEFSIAHDIPEFAFANGIRAHNGTIYVVSGESGSLYRIPVDEDARINGTPELIAADLSLDDFDIAEDGTIYGAAVWNSQVVKITSDGEVAVVAGGPGSVELLSCTSARLGRRADEGTIYVSTMGNGAFAKPGELSTEAKIVAIR